MNEPTLSNIACTFSSLLSKNKNYCFVFSAMEAETLQNGVARIPSGAVLVLLSKNKILMSYVFSATEAETLRNGVARFPLEQY